MFVKIIKRKFVNCFGLEGAFKVVPNRHLCSWINRRHPCESWDDDGAKDFDRGKYEGALGPTFI